MTADADANGIQVTLVCNGTTWEQEGLVAVSKSGAPPAATATISGLGDVSLSSPSNGDVLLYSAGGWVNGTGGGGGGLWTSGTGDDIYYNTGTPQVGVGKSDPSVALDVVGDINYTGTIVDVSDIRVKENIYPLANPLKKLTSIDGFSFTMKGDPNSTVEYGVSAQDVQKVFPELVKVVDPENETLGVNYQGLIAPMIEAMKEQHSRIEALEAQIQELEKRESLRHGNEHGDL